jgi:hypothetical protein
MEYIMNPYNIIDRFMLLNMIHPILKVKKCYINCDNEVYLIDKYINYNKGINVNMDFDIHSIYLDTNKYLYINGDIICNDNVRKQYIKDIMFYENLFLFSSLYPLFDDPYKINIIIEAKFYDLERNCINNEFETWYNHEKSFTIEFADCKHEIKYFNFNKLIKYFNNLISLKHDGIYFDIEIEQKKVSNTPVNRNTILTIILNFYVESTNQNPASCIFNEIYKYCSVNTTFSNNILKNR